MDKVSRLVMVVLCAAALLALPFSASCSSVVTAANSLTGRGEPSTSSQAADAYYLGIDGNGFLALYKGVPGDGSDPVRTTDIVASDLHESVVAGLEEGIVFDSFNDAIERIGDYREAARATEKSREAEKEAAEQAGRAGQVGQAATQEAEEAAKREAEQVEAAAAEQAPAEAAPAEQPDPAERSAASDENARAGEFWGVWLETLSDMDEAYAAADKAKADGFAAEVFEVTNWDGTVYVVGAGEFATKSEAQAVLSRAYELGYTSAYLHTAARQ